MWDCGVQFFENGMVGKRDRGRDDCKWLVEIGSSRLVVDWVWDGRKSPENINTGWSDQGLRGRIQVNVRT